MVKSRAIWHYRPLRHEERMERARLGDTVKVHYAGRLADGTEFDTSRGRGPLEFTVGRKQVILGFERAVIGMRPGTQKIENIPSSQAFGAHRSELVLKVRREQLGAGVSVRVGDQVPVRTADGRKKNGLITDADETGITVDANHPLAGQDLTFEIQLVEIVHCGSRLDEGLERVPTGAKESKIVIR
jgi:peptidylprolyl isomerase